MATKYFERSKKKSTPSDGIFPPKIKKKNVQKTTIPSSLPDESHAPACALSSPASLATCGVLGPLCANKPQSQWNDKKKLQHLQNILEHSLKQIASMFFLCNCHLLIRSGGSYGWLVVSTHLKNISQIGNLPQIGVKIKHI